ncbi:MAG TPA: hypothetical protein VLH56_18755 [Dissulfurispiraceae bacterium]|nr:hypothetical protein [Dissulfurispiraceae bacterium]
MNDRTFLHISAACNAAMDRDSKRRHFANKRLRGRNVTAVARARLDATFDALYTAELARIATDADL